MSNRERIHERGIDIRRERIAIRESDSLSRKFLIDRDHIHERELDIRRRRRDRGVGSIHARSRGGA